MGELFPQYRKPFVATEGCGGTRGEFLVATSSGEFVPYKVKKSGSGYKVVSTKTGKTHSRKPLSKKKAEAQMRALHVHVKDAR